METANRVWNYLTAAGLTPEGAAGLMGNIYAESGMIPARVEVLCLKRLKERGKIYTDATYTAFVDDGTISKEEFLHPLPGRQYGYGLCQWTSPGRKSGLYDLAKKRCTSIGDAETQLQWLLSELTVSYKEVLRILKSTRDVKTASDTVLKKFEMPADTGAAVRETRYRYAMKYYNEFNKEDAMATTRSAIVDLAKSWIGKNEADGSHKTIIDIYNSRKPLPRGYKVRYTDAWCATFVSALAIKLGYTDIIPVECGCPEMVELAKNMGIWQESDTYTPKIGDIIMYDWQDSGSGDNRGTPDHVGIVSMVSGSIFQVIEGNKNNAVGTRTMTVNGKNIRGYICPKYDEESAGDEPDPICGTCSVTLKQFLIGAEDPQIKIIQLKLNYLGYRGKDGQILAVDGQLGPNTAHAIEQLQRKAGLPDSTNWGTVGAKTWALILG